MDAHKRKVAIRRAFLSFHITSTEKEMDIRTAPNFCIAQARLVKTSPEIYLRIILVYVDFFFLEFF